MLGRVLRVIVHGIGNKALSERFWPSKKDVALTEKITEVLTSSLSSVKFSDATFQFFHESGELDRNNMYVFVNRLFSEEVSFIDSSCNIARQLYESSDHPRIKPGELLLVLFDDCNYHGKKCRALGLFKSESRVPFFDLKYDHGSYSITEQEGIDLGLIEKGAIVYDIEKENGYCISVLMRSNQNVDAKYWMNDFLHITQASDSFYKTQHLISLTKNYVEDVLSEDDSFSKVEQTAILSRASSYLNSNESFESVSFCREVFRDVKVSEGFQQYGKDVYDERMNLSDSFVLDKSLVKKKSRILKGVIKLDNNFHIYVHGGNGLIKRGFDPESGMPYYQLFFREEE